MTYPDIDLSRWIAEGLRFEETQAQSLDTSIRITADGLYFLGIHRGKIQESKAAYLRFTEAVPEALKNVFFAHPTLSLPFRSTRLYLDDGSGYTLVPDDLEPTGTGAEEWLSPVIDTRGKHTLSVHLDDAPASISYAVEEELYEFCQRSFVFPRFDHPQRPLTSAVMRYTRRHYPKAMMAILNDKYMDVALARQGSLLLANRYPIADHADVLYFVTALWRRFALDPTADHLHLYTAFTAIDGDIVAQHLSPSIAHLYLNDYPGLCLLPKALASANLKIPPELILDNLCE